MLAVSIYDGSFNYRCTTSDEDSFSISEFSSMTCEKHTFVSNNGQTLVGYLYQNNDSEEQKGVIVFAHGLGAGGQRGYMDIFNYLSSRGYYVFAYDATANDESEGDVIGGLPQGIIDLDYAISYAQTIDKIKNLPIVLMGYSWGGMSVGNVLTYHPEVQAAVTLAGWNKSMNMIDYRGCQMVGGVAKLLLPFASIYEYSKYGKYAFSTAMKGFSKTDCPIMIVHGELDDTIPIEYGYETYFKKHGENDRFIFKKYNDRDHEVMRDSDGNHDMALMTEIADFFDRSIGQ
jgi:dipeptidyl aminopeptidase/acylaminoacyl peptidase